MIKSSSATNKAFVMMAFDTLFNKRDYEAAETYWSPDYIQHSAQLSSKSGLPMFGTMFPG